MPIFGHDDVILGFKYLKYLKTDPTFEFSTLKLLKMQSFIRREDRQMTLFCPSPVIKVVFPLLFHFRISRCFSIKFHVFIKNDKNKRTEIKFIFSQLSMKCIDKILTILCLTRVTSSAMHKNLDISRTAEYFYMRFFSFA